MTIWKTLFATIALSLASNALALDLEGVYTITERQPCSADHIDTITILSDQDGVAHVYLASAEYTIVYQVHRLTVGADGSLIGATFDSGNAASFTATLSEDGTRMTGTDDSVVCPSAWTFRAEKVPAFQRGGLTSLDHSPSLTEFVGTFSLQTDHAEGTLRFVSIGDGRVSAGYGTAEFPRLVDFSNPTLDHDGGTLELFHYDRDGVRLKWHFEYGLLDGRLALQGYGIGTMGRYYPVNAMKL